MRSGGTLTVAARTRRAWPWLVPLLIVGLVATGSAFTRLRTDQRTAADRALDRQATAARDAVRAAAERYCSLLEATAAGIALDDRLTWEDFDAAGAPLAAARLPGATALGYVVPSSTAEISATQRRWRERGAEGLVLTAAAPAPEHYFTIFSRLLDDGAAPAPPSGDAAARPGAIDAAAAPEVVQALLEARRLSQPAVSDSYLPPEAPQRPSVVVAAPVWTRAAEPDFRGWIVLVVRGQDFLDGVDAGLGGGVGAGVGIAGGSGAGIAGGVGVGIGGELLATGRDGGRPVVGHFGAAGAGELVRTGVIPVADQEWTLVVRAPLPGGPLAVLPAGAAVTLLLAALAHLWATRRRVGGHDCCAHRHPPGTAQRPPERPGRRRPPARRAAFSRTGEGRARNRPAGR